MTFLSTGDLAIVHQLRNAGSQTKTVMNRLSQEMTSGIKSDRAQAVGGNLNALSALETLLSRLESYEQVIRQTTTTLTVVQAALSQVQSIAQKLGTALVSASHGSGTAASDVALSQAEPELENILSTLNMRYDGKYLFSGIASQDRPFPTAKSLIDSVLEKVAETDEPAEILAKIDAWMNSNAMYHAGAENVANIKISDRSTTSIPINGGDPALINTLKGLIIAAVTDRVTSASDQETRQVLMSDAGNTLLSAESQLSIVIGKVGTKEAQLADATSSNSAERTATQLARAALIEADPYETATALQAVETQLETLYTLTSRISRLTLTTYL